MIFEFIAEIVGQAIGEVLGYATGRLVIPILSIGAARSERFKGEQYLNPSRFYWRDGKTIVFSHDAVTLIGILFWASVGFAGYLFFHHN